MKQLLERCGKCWKPLWTTLRVKVRSRSRARSSLHPSPVVHQSGANPGFCSMNRSTPLDEMLVHRRVIPPPSNIKFLVSIVTRGTVRGIVHHLRRLYDSVKRNKLNLYNFNLWLESRIKMYDSNDRKVAFNLEIEFQICPKLPPYGCHLGFLKVLRKPYLFSNAHDFLPRRNFWTIWISDILLTIIQEHCLQLFKL